MKGVLSKIAIAIGAILFLGIIISKDFRITLGLLLDPILSPISCYKFHITIFFLSIITATYSNVIQKYTVDYDKLKKIQKIIRDYQKEYMEALKQKNQFKLKQLEKKSEEIKKLQGEMFNMQMKPMFYTGIVTIPIFAWLWEKAVTSYELIYGKGFGGNITHELPTSYLSSIDPKLFEIVVPFAGKIHVASAFIFPWWLWWYLLCSITIGHVVKKILKVGV